MTVSTTSSSDLDTWGRLEDSTGNLIVENDDSSLTNQNFRISTAVTSGTYCVRVSSYRAATTGDYIINASFIADLHSDTRSGASILGLNSSLTGQIGPNDDVDYFEVVVDRPGTLTVYTLGALDTWGQLEDSLGNVIQSNRGSGVGGNFRISEIVTAGTYYVRVESNYRSSSGNYTINADFAVTSGDHGNTRSNATPLPLNGSLSGRIAPSDDVDYFVVVVTRPGTLTVFTSGVLDTYGELEDGVGSTIAFNDDYGAFGTDINFRISTLVTSGTYYVKVTSFLGQSTGNYTIQANFQ